MVFTITKGQKYKHFKGDVYVAQGMATHTETMDGLVIYNDSNGNIWARPVDMFFGYTNDGKKRFTEIEDDE